METAPPFARAQSSHDPASLAGAWHLLPSLPPLAAAAMCSCRDGHRLLGFVAQLRLQNEGFCHRFTGPACVWTTATAATATTAAPASAVPSALATAACSAGFRAASATTAEWTGSFIATFP